MTIDYTALAERIAEHAALHDSLAAHSDEQRVWAEDLRTLEAMLRGMAEAKPDGEVVAGTGSLNDVAMIRWCSDYRPKIGDRIYAHPAPQPQPIDPHMIAAEDRYPDEPTEAQIEAEADLARIDAALGDTDA